MFAETKMIVQLGVQGRLNGYRRQHLPERVEVFFCFDVLCR